VGYLCIYEPSFTGSGVGVSGVGVDSVISIGVDSIGVDSIGVGSGIVAGIECGSSCCIQSGRDDG